MNSFKLKEEKSRLDVRRKLVTVTTVRHRNRLLREVLGASSLQAFKARLDGALDDLI